MSKPLGPELYGSELSGHNEELHMPPELRTEVREGYGDNRADTDDEVAVKNMPMGRTPMDDLLDEESGL
jgi:hypothetical protein